MKYFILIFVLCFSCKKVDQKSKVSLIGGALETHPELAGVFYAEDSCTYTKIGEYHFLTGGHCLISNDGFSMKIVKDQVMHFKSNFGEMFLTVDKVILQQEIINATQDNTYIHASDLGIIIVKESTPSVPILPVSFKRYHHNQVIYIVGGGCSNITLDPKLCKRILKGGDSKLVEQFSKSELKILADDYKLSISDAEKYLKLVSKSRYFMRGNALSGQTSIYSGDSGGPVIVREDGILKIIAVNSNSTSDDISLIYLNFASPLHGQQQFVNKILYP